MSEKRFDEELKIVDAAKKGDAKAQKLIYERYAPVMMSVCWRYVGDKETAKDMLQDGFIKLFLKLDMYAGTGAFAGWVRRVFVTTCLEYLRQKSALKLSNPIDDVGYNIPQPEVSVIEKMSADELMDLIADMPENFRTVFNLYVIEGYTHAEIAELIGITEVNSRTLFLRARKYLQNAIELIQENEKRNSQSGT
ncbi:MAG: RNA polymerase sigma factor [Paludibacter sp.]|jgi:RNA polymerase sigma-70 factor (ECF subfamily)|nr:sigma-70 family RNA polymerase sigma factor [Bacteroidales bacterium]HOG06236.1 sigma-70 family RNA polymerase sigma factor [Paludibacter sp.]HOS46455.1 sigma-70 family RNA polymerase sigma factor [Paludibacter sp.]